jgi:hypothetical protein
VSSSVIASSNAYNPRSNLLDMLYLKASSSTTSTNQHKEILLLVSKLFERKKHKIALTKIQKLLFAQERKRRGITPALQECRHGQVSS